MTNDKLLTTVLARSLFTLLGESQGIVIHFEKQGYIAYKQKGKIKVIRDNNALSRPDLSMLQLSNELSENHINHVDL